jgi:alpha-1,3-rhamnosyl/mannosyltransferase
MDVDALVQQLERLIGDRGLRVRLGKKARQTAEQFSWDRIAEQTLAVYRQVV